MNQCMRTNMSLKKTKIITHQKHKIKIKNQAKMSFFNEAL